MNTERIKSVVVFPVLNEFKGNLTDRRGKILEIYSQPFDALTNPSFEGMFLKNTVNYLRQVCSLLHDLYEYQPVEEANRPGIHYECRMFHERIKVNGKDVTLLRVVHETWTQQQTETFISIVHHLALLHGWTWSEVTFVG